ncbi:nuclease A inhibitor family protein [Nodosilinea sp. AN01ver1]|uniref:nuclease A inhibitor family protein n=1 Tax=Nodosilinea sp. AN01ver1 TaxID=3423362 RepID=UPI003D323CDA
MKLNTAKLLKEIEKAAQGSSFGSASDHPILPFIWEFDQKGILTPDKLLISEGFLRKENIDDIFPQNLKSKRIDLIEAIQGDDQLRQETFDFLSSSNISVDDVNVNNIYPQKLRYLFLDKKSLIEKMHKNDQRQKELLDFLSSNCKLVEAYKATKCDTDDYPGNEFESFPLIVAEFSVNQWIGFVPKIDVDSSAYRAEKIRDDAICFSKQKGETDESLDFFLNEVVERLSSMKFITRQYYEPDHEVDTYILETAKNKETLLSRLMYSNGFINICRFEDFSNEFENLKPLDELLRSNLTDLREYVVGCMSIFYLYDVGQTINGDWVGVRTAAVWT